MMCATGTEGNGLEIAFNFINKLLGSIQSVISMITLDDNTITIPNSKFLSDITSSGNYGALDMQVVIDFYIGADGLAHFADTVAEHTGGHSQHPVNRVGVGERDEAETTTSLN